MSTTAFLTSSSAAGDSQSDLEHLTGAVSVDEFGVVAGLVLDGDLVGLLEEVFEFGTFHIFAATEDADLARHQVLHTGTDGNHVFRAGILDEAVEFVLNLGDRVVDHRGRDVDAVFRLVAEVGDEFTDDHACNHGFGNRVAAEAVEAVHIPAGSFTGCEEALQLTGFARVVGTNAAHGVVLSRTDRDPFLRRVDAEEVVADFIHFTQVVLDVMFAEQRDV